MRADTTHRVAPAWRRRLAGRAGGVAVGLLADAVLGEPPRPVHPVAAFGAAMERLDGRWWRDDRAAGARYAAAGVGAAAAVGAAAQRVAGTGPSTAVAVGVSAAGRALFAEAEAVAALLARGDLAGARARLPALVGRDPSGLDEKEMARAVVESVAENLSDAVVASALWGVVGGAPAVLAHRAANTLDAMVGHRTPRYERFGWAAARLDDAAGWPAARVTAALVALAAPRRAPAVWQAVRRDAPRHPSPNAGVAEAAVAGALGVRLGGTNRYGGVLDVRPALGDGPPPGPDDIAAAVALGRRVVRLAALGSLALAWWAARGAGR